MPTSTIRHCPDCNGAISKSAESCPHCGYKAKASFNPVNVVAVLILLAIVAATLQYARNLNAVPY